MKHIQKNITDIGYTPLNGRSMPISSAQATRAWKKFSRHKPSVLQTLLQEQGQLCCYSEIDATKHNLGYHIEHIENKSQNPRRTFDAGNLAASAIKTTDTKTIAKNDVFGGHAVGKQQGCNMSEFISPLQLNCQQFFAYLSNGRVVPASARNELEKKQAQYTIDLLNLNSNYLVNLRKNWWQELEDELINGIYTKQQLAQLYLQPNQHQQLAEFVSVSKIVLGM